MKQVNNDTFIKYLFLNTALSAVLIIIMWLCLLMGGIFSSIGNLLGLPGYFLLALMMGTLEARHYISDFIVSLFLINFFIYMVIIGLVQLCVWKSRQPL